MDISFHTIHAGLNPAVGFGYASENIIRSLNELGHNVIYSTPNAKFQINFTQPPHYKLHKDQYQIGYTPWESTSMKKDWVNKFNSCDEVWATSDWVADVFKNNGVSKPIYVYPHGIDSVWVPKRRVIEKNKPIKFLHIGEPAPRKSGQMVVDAFIELFGEDPNYQLTIKAHHTSTIRIYDNKSGRSRITTPDFYSNIKLITEEYPIGMLVALYHSHHVLVYPSWGEGFGFIPLQGLATGMPVITTYDWAHYKKYVGPLKLKSKLTDETLPRAVGDSHVGQMYKPDKDHLKQQMLFASENYKAMSGYYYAQSTAIHEEYNWLQLTNNAFDRLIKKFS